MKEGRNIARLVVVIAFAVMFFIVTVPTAKTYPPFVSKAKSLGFPANNCTYCHVNAAGGAPYNARGKWLIAEKDEARRGRRRYCVAQRI
ncbi:MAG: hypothetical protein WKF84_28210 [Pyrinomonadaceae bacterium]